MDEIIDIGSPIRNRYKERPASITRCLKISMTDGIQRVFGIEYRPIKDLNVFSPAGCKVSGFGNDAFFVVMAALIPQID